MELVSKLWYRAWTDLRIIAIRISHMAGQAPGYGRWFYMCFLRSVSLSKLFRFIFAVNEVHREVRFQAFSYCKFKGCFHITTDITYLRSLFCTRGRLRRWRWLSLQLRLPVTLFLDFWRSHLSLGVPSLRMVRGEFLMDCDSDDTPTNSLACHWACLYALVGVGGGPRLLGKLLKIERSWWSTCQEICNSLMSWFFLIINHGKSWKMWSWTGFNFFLKHRFCSKNINRICMVAIYSANLRGDIINATVKLASLIIVIKIVVSRV